MDAKLSLGEPRVLISRDALLHNASVVRRTVGPGVRICAMVKADAYGHGADIVADTLANFSTRRYEAPLADALAVASIDEAERLPHTILPVYVLRPVENCFLGRQRSRIESAWGARVYDHSGMTEMGPVAFECDPCPGGLHVNEPEYIAEVIDPHTLQPLPEGSDATGELVLTNLGRWGSPLIRYRTGDQVRLVRADRPCACGRWFARLEGGILGRIDDMFIVRGNNVFPTAVEAVIRRFPEVAEFRLTVTEGNGLTQVLLEIEPAAGAADDGAALATRVSGAVQQSLSFRADVMPVPPGTLPRFELKAKRFVRKRVET